MSLTILNVAYPLATVSRDAVGGAEQIVSLIDLALTRAGHRSLVVACEGSECTGTLIPVPRLSGTLTHHVQPSAQAQCRQAIAQALTRWPLDLVHMHGLDFNAYLPPPGRPVLVTLHLPPRWYAAEAFHLRRPHTYLHCVSATQRRACPPDCALLPDIENGVPVSELTARHGKRGFVMALGRICWEKGFHLALDAATKANCPMLLAGQVFPYEQHQTYFRETIVPRLNGAHRFVGPVGFVRKRRLLTAARALLVPSLASETSSLVAMEALACGTPVIAYRAGALTEVVEHGVTGFLVNDVDEMAAAIQSLSRIDPNVCREVARSRFAVERMLREYVDLYQRLVDEHARRRTAESEAPHAA